MTYTHDYNTDWLIMVHLYLHIISVLFQYIYFLVCSHIICMCTFPFYYTHSLGHFLMTLNLHVQILDVLFYWSGVDELIRFTRAWSYPRLEYRYFLLSFVQLFPFLCVSVLVIILFYFYVHYYLVWTFTCVLQWSWFIIVDFFYSLFRLL